MSFVSKNIRFENPTPALSQSQLEAHHKFLRQLDTKLMGHPALGSRDIEFVQATVVYNQQISAKEVVQYGSQISVIYMAFPKASSEMSVKDSIFRSGLDRLFHEVSVQQNFGFERLTVIISYDRKPLELPAQKKNVASPAEDEPQLLVASEPRFRLSQMVLAEQIRLELARTMVILRQRELIYDRWGFAEIDPKPRAILNFFGPPGTGKTMAAHAIAHELGVKILALNYADIESKFVGDAPKNLVRAFETAQNQKALLFFDEADSFLGKRISNVSSSSDQAVNSLRSQLLILLENFDGVVIFATNLVKNYDRAFESRILKHLEFLLPDKNARISIIQKMIPEKLPMKASLLGTELEALSELTQGFSGREIKNAVLDTLTDAASRSISKLQFEEFQSAFARAKESKARLDAATNNNVDKDAIAQKIKSSLAADKDNLQIEAVNDAKPVAVEPTVGEHVLQIAMLASEADGVMQEQEKAVLQATAKAFSLDFQALWKAPRPSMEHIVARLDTPSKRTLALQTACNVLAADGEFPETERAFLRNMLVQFGVSDAQLTECLETTTRLAQGQKLLAHLFG